MFRIVRARLARLLLGSAVALASGFAAAGPEAGRVVVRP